MFNSLKMTLVVLSFLCPLVANSTSVELDQKLQKYIREFNLQALDYPESMPRAQVFLGARLFFEKKLSGNMNISCGSCHTAIHHSGDGLPLSLGQGFSGHDEDRRQQGSPVLARHVPHLINLGFHDQARMFWDGRVSFDKNTHNFHTPLSILNGVDPLAHEIARTMKHAVSAQALFPLITPAEMLGERGDNEIAALVDPELMWQGLVDRLLFGAQASAYQNAFKEAFPEITDISEIHIGHVAEAIGAFERHGFIANNTAWDRYLRGDRVAMTPAQKRGAFVFMERGRCVNCHNGPHLSDFEYRNIATPPIGPGNNVDAQDFGRFDVTGLESDRYKFRVPALRNVALTAPYMHNGAFTTLGEVVDHYNHARHSFMHFETSALMQKYGKVYDQQIERVFVRERVIEMFASMDENIWPPLFLTVEERTDLLLFLEEALTQKHMEFYKPWEN